MEKLRSVLFMLFIMLSFGICGQVPQAKIIFDKYFSQAQKFAKDFPHEKAYLHFDNTSYYVGDTIWFKAYVTLADQRQYSNISRPLYVELLDQSGHIADRQIIKLEKGEGNGQIILPLSMFSGYYEIRAYTRWMLAFDEPQYFSRTFPIYKFSGKGGIERNITTYTLSSDMEKRPVKMKDKLSLSFFPEGGQLVEGIESKVAFKVESKDSGNISLHGIIENVNGDKITSFETMHDGMGYFMYTPSSKDAHASVLYHGDKYEFQLPKALKSGYTIKTDCNAGGLSVDVSSNVQAKSDTLGLFISHQGYPCLYQLVCFEKGNIQRFILPIRKLPSGLLQVSLIDRTGKTLCERFVFSYPSSPLQIVPDKLKRVYSPYEPITCQLQVNTSKGEPVSQKLSVSIRDAVRSDYLEYDNNIFTDLLLTSDLKGYIHQPGYYFSSPSLKKQIELDLLLLIHGWRKYDMSSIIAEPGFTPKQLPESQLILNGQVKSTLFKKKLKDIELSVMLKKNEEVVIGSTVTDANGNFKIPLEDFIGTTEAIIQTKKVGKERTKDTSISIDRHFSPNPRKLDYNELHLNYKDISKWQHEVDKSDSLYIDSISKAEGMHLLGDVVVKSKQHFDYNVSTKISEKSIDAYYDVRRTLDELRDNGKVVSTIPELMEMISSQFYWNHSDDSYSYRQKPICFVMDNKILSNVEVSMMLTEVDGLSSIIISNGIGGLSEDIIQNSKKSDMSDSIGVDVSKLDKYCIFYLIPVPHRDVMNKSQASPLGTRQTLMQGYSVEYESYSPAYPNRELYMDKVDKRRTLYWNPSLMTDRNGKAIIKCYNNQYSTPLVIDVETLGSDGQIGYLKYSTLDN